MSSALNLIRRSVSIGTVSYVFCRVFNQQNAFEKAVLVTVCAGLHALCEYAFKHQEIDKYLSVLQINILHSSTYLLTVPCALYAGRVFNFKAADYLQIFGLNSIGYSINQILEVFYEKFPKVM